MFIAQNFQQLIGMEGMSESLLKNHFTLYEGYVKNVNALDTQLAVYASEGKFNTPEYNELKRRYGWEYNGMRLHELYFGNMSVSGKALGGSTAIGSAIGAQWGSIDAWAKDFKATGAMRGIGWVILMRDTQGGELRNVWVNEHDVGVLVGATPLLVMDVFEHAFALDYGINRAQYIEAFWKNINWEIVDARMQGT